MYYVEQRPLTIGTSASAETAELDLTNKTLLGVFTTATHTSDIQILNKCDDGNFYIMKWGTPTAANYTIDATAGAAYYALDEFEFFGLRKVKFRAVGTEAAERTIYAVFRQRD